MYNTHSPNDTEAHVESTSLKTSNSTANVLFTAPFEIFRNKNLLRPGRTYSSFIVLPSTAYNEIYCAVTSLLVYYGWEIQ